MAWYDHNWILAAATLLGVGIFVLQLRSMTRRNRFDSLLHAHGIFSRRFVVDERNVGREFYELRQKFTPAETHERAVTNPEWGDAGYHRSLMHRLEIVCGLPTEERDHDLALLKPIINALNDFAELIDLGYVDARSVLSKYHLAIAREAFIAEPYIVYAVLFTDRGRWGLRVLQLGHMARRYNDMNPVHRSAIYFLDGDRRDTSFGPIYLGPPVRGAWMRRVVWFTLRTIVGYPTITERSKRRQKRYLEAAEDQTRHLDAEDERVTAGDPPPLWQCPAAGPERLRMLVSQLDAWSSSPPLAELIALFGAALPGELPLPERLRWLNEFSARWDFRGMARERASRSPVASQDAVGASRWEIAETGLTAVEDERVVGLARDLGLVEHEPPSRHTVDYLLILGGARLSNLLRPQYAAEMIRNGEVLPRHVVLLGGSRPVMDSERDVTDSYARDAETEFDLLTLGGAQALEVDLEHRSERRDLDETYPNASWRLWEIDQQSNDLGLPIIAIEAPSTQPATRRANTADSYAFFASHLNLPAGTTCLLVTSQIYVPYQHLEGVRSLAVPFSLELETVGFPPDWQAERQGMQGPVNYLQETRSTIQAANRLHSEHLSDVAT